jgi:hypothetical protein
VQLGVLADLRQIGMAALAELWILQKGLAMLG